MKDRAIRVNIGKEIEEIVDELLMLVRIYVKAEWTTLHKCKQIKNIVLLIDCSPFLEAKEKHHKKA